MTVSTTQVRNVYTDPTAPTYPFTFRALSAADLVVTSIDAAGVETVLTRDTQWRATVLNNTGGTVQLLVSPPGAGGRIVIERSTPLLQPTDYANQGTFYPETHERSFDRLTLQLQEASDAAQRALTENPDGFPWYDAQGNRIINLGDAVGPTDAVNLQTLNAAIAGAGSVVEPLTWTFTGDGSERTFAITGAPTDSEGSYQVVIDGLSQSTADYEVNQIADQLVFVTAPPTGSSIFVRAFGFASPMTAMDWDAEGNRIENVGAPIDPTDAATRAYVDAQTATRAALGHTHDAGDVVSGQFAAPRLGGGTPTAVTVLYGDGQWRVPDATAGLPFVARGDLIAFDGTTAQRLGVGTNGQGLIADSSAPLGVAWGSVTVSDEQVQDVVGAMVPTTATITATYDDPAGTLSLAVAAGSIGASQLADGGVTSGKIAAGAVVTAALADGSITTVKIADAQVTVAKISATGSPSAISYLRGDGTWADSPFAATVHTHAAADVTSGIFNPARLGAGYGAIPPGDEQYFMLNAAGTWTRLEALYDGSVVPVGAGPSGGGSIDAETVRDIIGAALTDTATVDFTYNDGADQISAVVVPGSIGLTQVNTASLDTRYALVGSGGSGALPPGGNTGQFLRGDGNWSSTLLSPNPSSPTIWGTETTLSGVTNGFTFRSVVGGAPDGGALAYTQSFTSVGSTASTWNQMRARNDAAGAPLSHWHVISAAGNTKVGLTVGGFTPYLADYAFSGSAAGTLNVSIGDFAAGVVGNLSVNGEITRGAIGSGSAVTIDASRITSGIVGPARLGGGSPSSSTWLRGDGSWATLPSATAITVTDTPTIDLTLTAGSNLSAGIVPGSVGPSQLASSLELNANLVVGSASAGISGDKIRQGASTSVTIDGVTNGGPSGTLTGGALLDGSVITRKLGIGAVTATRIADGAVGAAKIANGAVSPAKLSAGGTTPTVDTVYHGDGTWRVPAGGSGGGFISGVSNTSSVALTVSGGVLTAQVPVGGINPSRLTASAGTPGPTTFYRGDGQWAVPAGAGGGVGLGDANIWTARNEWAQTAGSRQNRAWFAAASNTEAAFRMECVTQPRGPDPDWPSNPLAYPGTDRAGIMHIGNQRTGGAAGNSVLNVLDVQADMNVNGNFDIAMTDVAYARRFNAGAGFLGANWVVAQSPNRDYGTDVGFGYSNAPDPQGIGHSWTSGAVVAIEANAGNTWGDFGLIEDRRQAARWLAVMQVVPDAVGRPDSGRNYKYHISYGLAFCRSGPVDPADPAKPWQPTLNPGDPGYQSQTWIPIYLEENCTAPGGYQIKAWGGDTNSMAPYCIVKAAGIFQTGLDLSGATYIESNAPAIKLATNQRVRWGTDAEIWYDGTNLKARVGGTTVNIV